MRAKVREVVRAGADIIKVFQTGWARPHHGSLDVAFTREELAALVEESHTLGRKVASHAVGGPGLRMSIEAGVDTIEHGSYLDEDPELLRMMADKGIFFVPTFTVFIFHREVGTPEAQLEAAAFRQRHIESVQKALVAGVKVVAGTDAGGWEHGNNAKELECLVEAGNDAHAGHRGGHRLGGGMLRAGKDVGTVEAGKLADLVAVDGDP